jgi:hypothetical protein
MDSFFEVKGFHSLIRIERSKFGSPITGEEIYADPEQRI